MHYLRVICGLFLLFSCLLIRSCSLLRSCSQRRSLPRNMKTFLKCQWCIIQLQYIILINISSESYQESTKIPQNLKNLLKKEIRRFFISQRRPCTGSWQGSNRTGSAAANLQRNPSGLGSSRRNR